MDSFLVAVGYFVCSFLSVFTINANIYYPSLLKVTSFFFQTLMCSKYFGLAQEQRLIFECGNYCI